MKSSTRIALTASCLLVAALAIATAHERSHPSALPRSHERMEVRSSVNYTPAGISKGLNASGVMQRMLGDRRSRYKARRSCHQPNSTNEKIAIKITGDLHAAHARRDEILVNHDIFSALRPTRIRVGDCLISQVPASLSPSVRPATAVPCRGAPSTTVVRAAEAHEA